MMSPPLPPKMMMSLTSSLRSSSLLIIPVVIGGHPLHAVLDTGASASVISTSLAARLGIQAIEDKLSLNGLLPIKQEACRVCPNVNISIAGRHRPEHFVLQPRDSDLLLLGMTFIKSYGVQFVPVANQVLLPTKKGLIAVPVVDDTHDDANNDVFVVSTALTATSQPQNSRPAVVSSFAERVTELVTTDDVISLLKEHQDVFVEHSRPGKVDVYEHEIVTNTEKPVRSAPYRLGWHEENALKAELEKMLDLGIIRPSKGKWTSPMLFVKKKDDSLRPVIDFRKLNEVTIKDAYPLPIIDELLDSVGGAKFFSTLDAANGFWQIPMEKSSIEKTGFVTKFGTYEFLTMPFGLTSALLRFRE